jgi:hypothetical protein
MWRGGIKLMKIEITQKGVFDDKGAELKLGFIVEISADKMPAYLAEKARVLKVATPTKTPAKAK